MDFNRRSIVALIVPALFLCAVVSPGLAQTETNATNDRSPVYDVKSEATLTGTVQEVKLTPGRTKGRSAQGTHLVLKTSTETIEVHLGPSEFLKVQKLQVTKGETVEIVGSRVKVDGVDVLLAREVRKGEASWTLRDTSGRPRWSRGRRPY